MPEMLDGNDIVWRAAYQLTPDCAIEVEYWSNRGERKMTVTGKPDSVMADRDGCRIDFIRDDGQKMIIDKGGMLLSVGSHFPKTGEVIEITLHYNED